MYRGQKQIRSILTAIAAVVLLATSARAKNVHNAAWDGDFDAVRKYVDAGGSVDSRSRSGGTILSYAAGGPNTKLVEYLIEKGANPNATKNDGATPLHYAAREGRLDNVTFLIARGAKLDVCASLYKAKDWDARDQGPMTGSPLHWAIALDKTEAAKLLISARAGIEMKDSYGFTPLHIAALRGNDALATILLAAAAAVNSVSRAGITPLHLAVLHERTNTVWILLRKGADPNAVGQFRSSIMEMPIPGSTRGVTPLQLAKSQEIRSLLQKYGAR